MPQLSMMPELINVFNKESGAKVKKVTTVRTICDMMNNTFIKLVKLCSLKWTSYLKSTYDYSHSRKNIFYNEENQDILEVNYDSRKAMTLHIHKGRTDELNITDIAQQFISFNERQMHTFGTFH